MPWKSEFQIAVFHPCYNINLFTSTERYNYFSYEAVASYIYNFEISFIWYLKRKQKERMKEDQIVDFWSGDSFHIENQFSKYWHFIWSRTPISGNGKNTQLFYPRSTLKLLLLQCGEKKYFPFENFSHFINYNVILTLTDF